jgi:hypothetical protein
VGQCVRVGQCFNTKLGLINKKEENNYVFRNYREKSIGINTHKSREHYNLL